MTPYADFLYFGVLLYVAVPALLLGVAGRWSWRWVLLATAVMLAVQYGGSLHIEPHIAVREIWVVAAYALFEWAVALGFLHVRARTQRRWPFYLTLGLALAPLLIAKYVPLFAPDFLFGFLGISYVTFRTLDVIFCVQDRLITALPPLQFLAYLFFFATISSGPIDRYRRFDTDWKHRRTRTEFMQDLDAAVHRVFTGFLYKFILAVLVKQYWMDPAAEQAGFLGVLSYMYAYSFYLFFDFAGYSAFAIGVSYLFGIHTPENFDRPFLARNIRDFWNRWHISLSWWFRDHVYMRFVMAATKGRWFKNKHLASYLGFLLAFGLMGVWHGTEPHYVLYGLYHGGLLAAYDAFSRWNKERKLWGDGTGWRVAEVCLTFQCVCFGFLLFSGHLGSQPSLAAVVAETANIYDGAHDATTCDMVGGWVEKKGEPELHVSVDIYADAKLLATIPADRRRGDLYAAGKRPHAFLWPLPSTFYDGEVHEIRVRPAGTDVDLPGTPRSIICDRNMVVQSMDGLEGTYSGITCESIGGIAWDAAHPDMPVNVDIRDGDALVATIPTDVSRPDLLDRQYGNERHTFTFPTPPGLKDGKQHVISVRFSGTNVYLAGSPKLLKCEHEVRGEK